MLKKLKSLLNLGRFSRDEKGNIMIMTAFMAPALMMAGATAIDLGEMYRAKTNFQIAVDSSTLAFAKEYAAANSSSGQQQLSSAQRVAIATPIAEEVFYANLRNISAKPKTHSGISFDVGSGDCNTDGAVGTAYLDHKVFFPLINKINKEEKVHLVNGQPHDHPEDAVHLQAKSTVKCSNSAFEIALVLDNSGSMRWSGKMTTLRAASRDLVNTMFSGSSERVDADPISFSVVPFAGMVNVGSENENASWMDNKGLSSIHHEHLNWADNEDVSDAAGGGYQDNSGNYMTRFTLFDNLPGISWKGCVEARPNPYHLTDEEPTEGNPDSLYVPAFAPDTPDDWTGEQQVVRGAGTSKQICTTFESKHYYVWEWKKGKWRQKKKKRSSRDCERWSDNYTGTRHPQDFGYRPEYDDRIEYKKGRYLLDDAGEGSAEWEDDQEIYEEKYLNNYLKDDHNFPESDDNHPRLAEYVGTGEDQYKRQKWTWKYFQDSEGNDPDPHDVNNDRNNLPSALWEGGPNNMCRTPPITDLTTNKDTVLDALGDMEADGSTNIQAGVAWGWRTLSPGEPFSNGRSYDDLNVRKIMIVMSDGNNTYYPSNYYSGYSQRNKSYYGAWGQTVNGRIFDGFDAIANPDHTSSTFQQAMDSHLVKTCNNAKAAGIQIYTIAFDVPNGSSVQSMLRSCATTDIGGNPLYFPADNNAALIKAFEDIQESLSELRLSQ